MGPLTLLGMTAIRNGLRPFRYICRPVNAFLSSLSKEDVPLEIKDFLRYIRNGTTQANGSLAERISEVVCEAKAQKKWSVEYMRWEDELKHREFLLKKEIAEQKQRADEAQSRADEEKVRADAALRELEEYKKRYGELE